MGETAEMTTKEVGLYFCLLNFYFICRGPITSNPRTLGTVCGMSKTKFINSFSETVRSKFSEKDGKLFHKRMEEEVSWSVKHGHADIDFY